jgi:hypothetical protein
MVLGIEIESIGADSFWVAGVFLLIFVCLRDEVLRFIVRIPADPMQEGKAIAN